MDQICDPSGLVACLNSSWYQACHKKVQKPHSWQRSFHVFPKSEHGKWIFKLLQYFVCINCYNSGYLYYLCKWWVTSCIPKPLISMPSVGMSHSPMIYYWEGKGRDIYSYTGVRLIFFLRKDNGSFWDWSGGSGEAVGNVHHVCFHKELSQV